MNFARIIATLLGILLAFLFAPAGVTLAQNAEAAAAVAAEPNPLSAHGRSLYGGVKKILLRSAETMPEEKYGFRPAETVRSFGEIVGHVADSQYAFCAVVLGEKNPSPKVEKSATSKADLVAALTKAFGYCDRAYDAMTDASAAEMVTFMRGETPKLGVLNTNSVHRSNTTGISSRTCG